MSRSATPATRNEATKRWKPPKISKNDHLCRTYHRHGHTVLTRTVAAVNATPSEHTLNPQTPRVKREPLLRIREKCACPTSKKLDFADKIEKCMEMREAGRWWRKTI